MKTLTQEQLTDVRNVYINMKGGTYDKEKVLQVYDNIKPEITDETKLIYIRKWYVKNRYKLS